MFLLIIRAFLEWYSVECSTPAGPRKFQHDVLELFGHRASVNYSVATIHVATAFEKGETELPPVRGIFGSTSAFGPSRFDAAAALNFGRRPVLRAPEGANRSEKFLPTRFWRNVYSPTVSRLPHFLRYTDNAHPQGQRLLIRGIAA
jgi:hypothetical protein